MPGDKSISHRAVLLSLLAAGPCRVRGWLECEDTLSSLKAVQILGVRVRRSGDFLELTPADPSRLPAGDLDIHCGNSGTTARLLCGLLAGWLPREGCRVILRGDDSLSGRPMARVVNPLRRLGARLRYLEKEDHLPVRISGAPLQGTTCRMTVPSAQVKSALLLAATQARGTTVIQGGGSSRDHTERLLSVMGQTIDGFPGTGDLGLQGLARLQAYDIQVPADPSSAAFFQVAAALIPGSRLTVPNQSLNPGRCGALAVLRRSGAQVGLPDTKELVGEPMGPVTVAHHHLRPFRVAAPEIPALIDELPVLAVLASRIPGRTVISGAEELRVKESDRIATTAAALRALGARLQEQADGWIIEGGHPLRGGTEAQPLVLKTAGDHRIAMAMAVAALVAGGTTALDDDHCVGVSYPEFFSTLENLRRGKSC